MTAFKIPGLKIWFYSNDHEPPHFHVKRRGEWEVKVHFLLAPEEMIDAVFGQPGSGFVKQITRLTEEHRMELLEEWQRIHGVE
ncbi:DUF4160 domain-containing protein [Pirellulaceae bacterium SH449]